MNTERIQNIGANTQNFTPIPEGKLEEPIENLNQLENESEDIGETLSSLLLKKKNPLFSFFGFG